ncbi:MAG TPA: hypothetical protein VIM61_00665 [Chthoniobacterales bacterium]
MTDPAPTRTGKIASLPARIREQVNQRLHDGASGPQILAWLHTLPEVLTVLDEKWSEQPISPQNLSEWRGGGYQDWLRKRENIANIKLLSDYSLEIAKSAGTSISDAAAAIAGGQILEALEKIGDAPDGEERLVGLSLAIAKLRDGDSKILRARMSERAAEQKDRQLDLDEQKFRYRVAEEFVKWAKTPEAQAILNSADTEAVQMEKLVQLVFGERPETTIE